MSLDSPLHLAAHPQPLDSVTVYSSPMVIPVTGPVVLDGAVAVAGSRVVHVGTRRWVFNELKHDMATNGRVVEHHWKGIITPGLIIAHTHLQYTDMAEVGRGTYDRYLPQLREDCQVLGVAFAEQQLVAAILKNPDYIRLAAPRVSGGTFLDAGLGRADTLLCEKGAKGEYLDLSALSEELPEETVSLISRVLAQNYDIGLSAQDVELYLDRIEHSQPVSSTAGGRTAAELADYLQALKDKKT